MRPREQVTFRAIDAGGNVGVATADVSVVDTTPPTITPPVSIVAERRELLRLLVEQVV